MSDVADTPCGMEHKDPSHGRTPETVEKRADPTTIAVVTSAGASVISAGAAVYTALQNRPSQSPPPEPPSVVLPPGVDKD